jgi:hypothetical protein
VVFVTEMKFTLLAPRHDGCSQAQQAELCVREQVMWAHWKRGVEGMCIFSMKSHYGYKEGYICSFLGGLVLEVHWPSAFLITLFFLKPREEVRASLSLHTVSIASHNKWWQIMEAILFAFLTLTSQTSLGPMKWEGKGLISLSLPFRCP